MGAELTLQPPTPPGVPSPGAGVAHQLLLACCAAWCSSGPRPGSQSPSENFQGLGPAWVILLTYWRKLKFIEVHL